NLPKGCFIQLERVAKDHIIESIRNVTNDKRFIVRKIKDYARDRNKFDVVEFCELYNVDLTDIYKSYSFTQLLAEAGVVKNFDYKKYKKESDGLSRLLHINSMKFIQFVLSILNVDKFNYGALNKKEKL